MIGWNRIVPLVAVGAFTFVGATLVAQPKDETSKQPPAAQGQKQEQWPQLPLCPVEGGPVDFSVKADTKDGPVYFCCKDCIKKYEAEPQKYAKQVAGQRKVVAAMPKVQVTCPVSGEPVDRKVSIERDGKKVWFCCKGCVAKYEKEPAKYGAKLAESYTFQAKCPVMGEDIDPKAFVTLTDGRRVFFCCGGCDKKFLSEPAKYAPKLAAQGMKIDPDKIKAEQKAGPKDKPKEPAGHEGHGHEQEGHGGHGGH